MSTSEQWKKAPGEFQFYEVSNTGRIRNSITGRELKRTVSKDRHTISLTGNNSRVTYSVGRLVAEVFMKGWDRRKKIYRRDGDPMNDHIDNLYQRD